MARRSARLVAAVTALAVTLLGAGACSSIDELLQLQDRIERRGYDVESVFHEDFGTGRNEVQVEAGVGRGQRPPAGNEEIAGVVWETYPRRFTSVVVTLDGESFAFSRGDLQERFGPRPTRLDEREFSDDVGRALRRGAIAALVALVALVVVIAGVIALVVFLRRRRRNRPPPPPPFGGPRVR